MSIYLQRSADNMERLFPGLPWTVRISYGAKSRTFGSGPERAEFACRGEAPLRDLARGRLPAFMDRYVFGEVDFLGDIYSVVGIRNYLSQQKDWIVGLGKRLRHLGTTLFPSSVRRKLVAVSSHYDLPNAFIESYLDNRTRAYSCAMWKDPANIAQPDDETLEEAQDRKFRSAAEELEVQPGDKFLDVGCGYGYMVNLVEKDFGCRNVLGITLSENQVATGYSKNLKLRHYHELEPDGSFDKIYTCGMVSHLDRSEIRRYYRHIHGLLKSGGRFWMHGIVPPANGFGMTNYNSLSGTFSQKYVFPDHYQFPVHVHLQVMEEAGFRVKKVHFRYGHYSKTLRHWYRRYVENLPRTRHLITPVTERVWHLFLTYASVLDGPHSVIKQILAEKA
ncbi:MAG: class I SAM-dependent methyltransferase [Elusimicrobiota bacterium]